MLTSWSQGIDWEGGQYGSVGFLWVGEEDDVSERDQAHGLVVGSDPGEMCREWHLGDGANARGQHSGMLVLHMAHDEIMFNAVSIESSTESPVQAEPLILQEEPLNPA